MDLIGVGIDRVDGSLKLQGRATYSGDVVLPRSQFVVELEKSLPIWFGTQTPPDAV